MRAARNYNHFARTMLDHPAHEHLWWEDAKDRLEWRPIADYPINDDLALAEPVILRAGDAWVYGAWSNDGCSKVTEGASWPLPGFEPTEWAEPALDEAIMLGQE